VDAVDLKFDRPPIDEVAFSIQFKPLEGLLVPYYGLLWDHFRADYPACEDVAPLLSLAEGPDGAVQEEPQFDVASLIPRVWFLQPDGPGLIQVQRNRFIVNWRRRQPEDKYPGFPNILRRFRQHLNEFEAFLKDHEIGQLAMEQYELTYINVVAKGEGWNDAAQVSRIFPHFTVPNPVSSGVLGVPEGLAWKIAFPLPENKGRLHASLQQGRRRRDGVPVLHLNLTARGIGHNSTRDAMWDWFDLAHRSITEGFHTLTSEEVQRDVWQRHQ